MSLFTKVVIHVRYLLLPSGPICGSGGVRTTLNLTTRMLALSVLCLPLALPLLR